MTIEDLFKVNYNKILSDIDNKNTYSLINTFNKEPLTRDYILYRILILDEIFQEVCKSSTKDIIVEFLCSYQACVLGRPLNTIKFIVQNYGVEWIDKIYLEKYKQYDFKNYCYLKNQIKLAGS